MMSNYERCKQESAGGAPLWDQRPWFRLFLNHVVDLNLPRPALDPISCGILIVFGSALHIVKPLVVPGESHFNLSSSFSTSSHGSH